MYGMEIDTNCSIVYYYIESIILSIFLHTHECLMTRHFHPCVLQEMEPVINIILTMSYYFYNLTPLSQGSR